MLTSFLVTLFVVSIAGIAVLRNGTARTWLYYSLRRNWWTYWPLRRGGSLPVLLRPAFRSFGEFVPIRCRVSRGIVMVLDPVDTVTRKILEFGVWEETTWKTIEEHLQKDGVFIDIGSHVGYFALKAARHLTTKGHVLAIEPNPKSHAALRKNIELSGIENITARSVACFDVERSMPFYGGARDNSGMSSLARGNAWQTQPEDAVQIETRRLDSLIRELGVQRVDVIKLDAEGAELQVLCSGEETLRRFRPVLIIEEIESQLAEFQSTLGGLQEFLFGLGYTQGRLFEGNREWLPDSGKPTIL